MARISRRQVEGAKPSPDGKRWVLWDDRLTGFGLLVLPSGVKSYVFDYRTVEGRKRRATIGKANALTPDQARTIAEKMSATVKAGGDPLDAKARARQAATVGDILDAYLKSGRFVEKAASTQAVDQGRIRRHLRPLLGRTFANKLTAEDVRRAFAAIRDGKTATDEKTKVRGRARVTGGETAARDSISLLRAILNWAVAEGLAKQNPAQNVKLGTNGQREIFLDDPDHYRRLFATLADMQERREIRAAVADCIRVIALTGARRGEIVGARWRHVDMRAGTIVLPPASHKTGRRTGKPRVIHLPTGAQEIIARQPAGEADDLVFKPAKGEGPIALSKPWRKIRQAAELPEGIGLHGLRHSVASWLALGGAQAAEIMGALGHRQLSTAQRYIHFADTARAALAERAAAPVLAGLAAAKADATPAEVVPIATAKRGVDR